MNMDAAGYSATAEALVDRIVALGPQILEVEDAWGLFKVPGFQCDDLHPSFYQAQFALAKAKAIVSERGVGS